MKEKIINYIETLEAKAYQSDDYFKQRNDLYIENQNKDKEIERLNNIINEMLKKIQFYKTTEWGLRGYGILENFENILNGDDVKSDR